jgi:two-component system OmpR family response regulator
MRILVVDDEIDTLGLIELTLQTAGYDVKTAPSGEEALKQLRAGGFDAVLLDEMMPDRTGSDVLRTLREENVAVPPVIFLTAKSRPEDRAAGASLGAADYLVKPTTRGQLLDAIRKLQETSSTT